MIIEELPSKKLLVKPSGAALTAWFRVFSAYLYLEHVVLILDGNSEYGLHFRSNLFTMVRSRAVINSFFFSENTFFP